MLPEKIGRYGIKAELGRGGMSTVYLAHDPHFDRDVAVKLLPHELLHHGSFRRRFDREAKIVASLEHPAIVPVYDFGEESGQPFLVMRFMAGGSLTDRLIQGALSIQETSRIVFRLASALDEVHRKGVVHRDLKPSNILFDQRNEPFISDFGTATYTFEHTKLTETGGAVGTPAYMSPEQIQGASVLNGRSDIYSLGVILFEMLTGQHPFQTNTPLGLAVKHIFEPIPSIREMLPDLPVEGQKIIATAMAKNPEDRYQTAGELADNLREIIQNSSGEPLAEVVVGKTAVLHSRRFALIIHTDTYEDTLLSHLACPATLTHKLADLLKDPNIGNFDEVICAVNETGENLRRTISRFFADKKHDDFLLLYYSGHVALDDNNHMHFAVKTTDPGFMRATSISGVFLADEMENSRAQKQLLVLDCFFSKMMLSDKRPTHYLPGVVGKAIDTGATFSRHGRHRLILSASDSIHYVWQGSGVSGEPGTSRFSEFFIDGLANGAADIDNNGSVTLNELYRYIKDRTHADTKQLNGARHVPRIWLDDENDQVILAQNPFASPSGMMGKQSLKPLFLSRVPSQNRPGWLSKPQRWVWWFSLFMLIGFLLALSGQQGANGRSTILAASNPALTPTPPVATPPPDDTPKTTASPLPTPESAATPFTAATTATTLPTAAPQVTPTITQTQKATVRLPASIFAEPDTSAAELAILSEGDEVTILGRSVSGNWFYVLTDTPAAGFVFNDRLTWSGIFEELPQVPTSANAANAANCVGQNCPLLKLDLYPLPGNRCEGGIAYRTIYMHGQGGNGRYTYYWNDKKLTGPITEGFGFEVNNQNGNPVIGIGKVTSGDGQSIEKELFVTDFSCGD
ncbi:MAG: protein kinase [Chloroflexota bacterium]